MSFFKCFVVSLLGFFGTLAADVEAIYLSWVSDPMHTMAVHWIDENIGEPCVYSQKVGSQNWIKTEGKMRFVEGSYTKVYVAELTGLEEGTAYKFRVGSEKKSYEFQTLSSKEPLKFVVGGDAYFKRDLFEKMNKEVARCDPDFVVMGGDIAYTVGGGRGIFKGREWEVSRWKAFFKEWQKSLVKGNGQLIPIIPVVGNHDVGRKGSGRQVMFYTVFSFPQEGKAYQVVDIGNDFSLFLLDTGHTAAIDGEQTDWLKKALEKREDRKVKMAAYHIAAFPSFYSYDKAACVKIRENWVPLFEQYGVSVAFEHHNHCYKRTYPIKEEKIDPKGIVYLGDGSWGVPPRIPLKPGVMWYLAETRSENACFFVKVDEKEVVIEAHRNNGKLVEPAIMLAH